LKRFPHLEINHPPGGVADADCNPRDNTGHDTRRGSVPPVVDDTETTPPPASKGARVRRVWHAQLGPGQRSAVIAWASFATTFGFVRGLTHWIRDGHGPAGGGMSIGGKHFHHYNLGIGALTALGAIAIRGAEQHRRHPVTAAAYGTATALIADEAALLLDLQDVYWSKEGRTSVDLAIGVIALGGLAIAGIPLWPALTKELRR